MSRKFIVLNALLCLLAFLSCDPQERRFQQFYSYGQIVYERECASCHGMEGLPELPIIPPLAGTEYMYEDTLRTLCIIRYGMSGPLEVNGKTYNMRMPPAQSVNDVEMAYLMTYLYSKWKDSRRVFEREELDTLYSKCISYSLNLP